MIKLPLQHNYKILIMKLTHLGAKNVKIGAKNVNLIWNCEWILRLESGWWMIFKVTIENEEYTY